MTAYATSDDVAAAWRPLLSDEVNVADELLDFAAEIIRSEISDVDDRITAGTLTVDLVKGINRAMVLRVMKNPNGARSVTQQHSIDDYSESTTTTTDAALSTGELYLTDTERKLLTARRSSAFSIAPGRPAPTQAQLDQVLLNRQGRCP